MTDKQHASHCAIYMPMIRSCDCGAIRTATQPTEDERVKLVAMFTELYNCYTASKCAAGDKGDREEFLRLKGMAEAYQDAANRIASLLPVQPAPAKSLLREPVKIDASNNRLVSPLVITRDGVSCPDQTAALEEFKERCRTTVQPAASTPTEEAFDCDLSCARWVPYDEHHRRYEPEKPCTCGAAASTEPVYGSGREFMLNSRFNDPVVSTETQDEK